MKILKLNEMEYNGEPEVVRVNVDNIGDLKRAIEDLPDDMGFGVTTNGGDGLTDFNIYIGTCGDFPGERLFIVSVH
jgi:hypothetical protein